MADTVAKTHEKLKIYRKIIEHLLNKHKNTEFTNNMCYMS